MRTLSRLLAIGLVFSAFSASAQTSSSKATAAINTSVGCTFSGVTTISDTVPVSCHDIFSGAAVPVTPDNFATVMKTTIKVSNSQSLFVSPSLVTGLYTQTKARTSPGTASTATGSGGVFLRAIVTNNSTGAVTVGYPAAACAPGILGCQQVGTQYGVTLDTRIQTLTQDISACLVTTTGGSGSCTFDLTTDLIQKTTSAHSFNFIFPSVGVGTYTIEIQAAVSSAASVGGLGTATGAAAYGLGSVTVESVRMVHDFSF